MLHLNEVFRFKVQVKDVNGVLTDPTSIKLTATEMTGETTMVDDQDMVRESEGVYYYDTTMSELGEWEFKVTATSAPLSQIEKFYLKVYA